MHVHDDQRTRFWVILLFVALAASAADAVVASEAVRYVLTVRDPALQKADVSVTIPTDGQATVELMMPVWSPGFYRVEDYAQKVQNLEAHGEDGVALEVTQPSTNTWLVEVGRRRRIVIAYRLLCDRRSVTTNEIVAGYAVLNPAATFVIPRRVVRARKSPIEVRLDLPADWTAMSALQSTSQRYRFKAPSYETLVDSPLLAGKLSVHRFEVANREHLLVDAGDSGEWDGGKGAADLAKIVAETQKFWGFLPFKRYLFLNVFRQGGGGLEHKDSTLLTSSAARMKTPHSYLGWLGFVGHEYFHAFNVKRLRPVELGPFDFDRAPRTTSLWISEGLTTYFADLMIRRSGLSTREEFLDGLSTQIRSLQRQPGRLLQTVETSSYEVWNNSNSGVNPTETTVSYYVKGDVLGFVLDARIRKATMGRRSIDDLMRLAYKRYSGERGFTAEQFRQTASEVAGVDLTAWFHKATASTEEVDYSEALDWFGLRFAEKPESDPQWSLAVRADASAEQRRHLNDWLSP